jgi:hypothetical protein
MSDPGSSSARPEETTVIPAKAGIQVGCHENECRISGETELSGIGPDAVIRAGTRKSGSRHAAANLDPGLRRDDGGDVCAQDGQGGAGHRHHLTGGPAHPKEFSQSDDGLLKVKQ